MPTVKPKLKGHKGLLDSRAKWRYRTNFDTIKKPCGCAMGTKCSCRETDEAKG